MLLWPCSLTIFAAAASFCSFSNLRELDQHRQIYSGNDFDFVLIEKCRGDICRRTAKHVCQDQNAIRRLYAFQAFWIILVAILNIIVPTDRNGRDVMDLPDDHLRRIQQLDRQPAMSDNQSADHFITGCALPGWHSLRS